MKLISVYDIKSELWSMPMTAETNKAALRAFGNTVEQEGNEINQHPEDYELWEIGEYDNHTGEIKQEHKELIARGGDVKHELDKES